MNTIYQQYGESLPQLTKRIITQGTPLNETEVFINEQLLGTNVPFITPIPGHIFVAISQTIMAFAAPVNQAVSLPPLPKGA